MTWLGLVFGFILLLIAIWLWVGKSRHLNYKGLLDVVRVNFTAIIVGSVGFFVIAASLLSLLFS